MECHTKPTVIFTQICTNKASQGFKVHFVSCTIYFSENIIDICYDLNVSYISWLQMIFYLYHSTNLRNTCKSTFGPYVCVSTEPILFMKFNMIWVNIHCFSSAYKLYWCPHYQCILPSHRWGESYHLSHQLGHANAFTWARNLYYLSGSSA